MFDNVVLVTDSGCDVTPDIAERFGIYLVPMKVILGEDIYEDTADFPPDLIFEYLKKTGKPPKTSGSNPSDFVKVYDEIHEKWPEKTILYVGYSSVTTISFSSALKAAEGRSYFRSVDTKHFSICAASILFDLGERLEASPGMTADECVDLVLEMRENRSLFFLPYTLEFLKAGGRLSNGAALAGRLLRILPCIETHDGRLVAGKKYRGHARNLGPRMLRDVCDAHLCRRDRIYFVKNYGTDPQLIIDAEETAKELGFRNIKWFETGGVITAHSGPGTFGFVVFF